MEMRRPVETAQGGSTEQTNTDVEDAASPHERLKSPGTGLADIIFFQPAGSRNRAQRRVV